MTKVKVKIPWLCLSTSLHNSLDHNSLDHTASWQQLVTSFQIGSSLRPYHHIESCSVLNPSAVVSAGQPFGITAARSVLHLWKEHDRQLLSLSRNYLTLRQLTLR